MLGALATVALIVTTGAYATYFEDGTLAKSYLYWPINLVEAQFLKADSLIELHKSAEEQNDRITVMKDISESRNLIYALPDGPLEEINTEELCEDLNGVLLPESRIFFCDVSIVSWVLDTSSCVPGTTYFGIYFRLGWHGPLHLTVPVFEMPADETVDGNWEETNRAISLSDPAFVEQLSNLLNDQTNSITFSLSWLKRLFEFKLYKSIFPMRVDGEPITSYATRPVLLPRWLIDEFLRKISNRCHSTKRSKKQNTRHKGVK